MNEPLLVMAARRFHAGEASSPDVLMGAFRAADICFERLPEFALPTVRYEDSPWVPVFSTPERLACFVAQRDGRTDGDVPYISMRGSRLMDVYLRGLEEPAGLVLDPLDPHILMAPPPVVTTSDLSTSDLVDSGAVPVEREAIG
jgi:hypothetical protein